MPLDRADRLLSDWAELAPRLLLFLANVKKISILRWPASASKPEYVAKIEKSYLHLAEPFPHLPAALGEIETYSDLRERVLGKNAYDRGELSKKHFSVVRIKASGPLRDSASDITWLVVQRFDVVTPELLNSLRDGCDAVPIVGLALPISAARVAIVGAPFCFLPIGSMRTGLPLHVNGSFHVASNRRSLWLNGGLSAEGSEAQELDGKHKQNAAWNEALMRHAVPQLWLEVLRMFTTREVSVFLSDIGGHQVDDKYLGGLMLDSLPDLDQVRQEWQPCAKELYKLLSGEKLLPHVSAPRWVAPSESLALSEMPTEALALQTGRLMLLYQRSPALALPGSGAKFVVELPAHVRRGCCELSSLREIGIEQVLSSILRADRGAFSSGGLALELQPILLALLDHAGASTAFTATVHQEWKGLLAGVPWVKTSTGAVVELAKAFAPLPKPLPGLCVLDEAQLWIVRCNRAVLPEEESIVRTAIAWGLKADLTWDDCVAEARSIAEEEHEGNDLDLTSREAWARRLVLYITSREAQITEGSSGTLRDVKVQKAELSKIAFHPAREACATFDHALTYGDHGVSTPQGAICLRAAETIFEQRHAAFVWAVRASAPPELQARFLTYAKLTPAVLVQQIEQLAGCASEADEAQTTRALAAHLLRAVTQLASHAAHSQLSAELVETLSRVAWVPASNAESGELRLFVPSRVAIQLRHDLWPRFGRLPDEWRSAFTTRTILTAAGVGTHLSSEMLASELSIIASEAQPTVVRSPTRAAAARQHQPLPASLVALSVQLVNELAANLLGKPAERRDLQLRVPTATSHRLLLSSQVFINDAPWHSRAAATQVELLHDEISPANGRILGCASVREELARACEQDLELEGEDFAQSEPIRLRIEGLLKKYNDQKDVFVEQYARLRPHKRLSMLPLRPKC